MQDMRQGSEDRQLNQGDQENPQDKVRSRYFLLGQLPEEWTDESNEARNAVIIRMYSERNDWVPGHDTFLHDVASMLGADALLLGDYWLQDMYDFHSVDVDVVMLGAGECSDKYQLALLAAARACGKPVIDARTVEHSSYGVIPWGVINDEGDVY